MLNEATLAPAQPVGLAAGTPRRGSYSTHVDVNRQAVVNSSTETLQARELGVLEQEQYEEQGGWFNTGRLARVEGIGGPTRFQA